MISRLQLVGIVAVGTLMLLTGSYHLGKQNQRQQSAVDAAQSITKAIQNRAGINETIKTWIALLCVLSLAGCASNASNCAGWQQISVKPDTAVYLAGNDAKAGTGVAGHNAYGKKVGCW